MREWMRNIAIVAALLAAMPLAAQEPTPTPAPAPTLEKPGMAPATEEQKPVAKPKAPAAPAKANSDGGRVVEEIIARVNNEIITRSEYDKALATADEEVRQDCRAKCTPEQLQAALEDRKKNTLRDLIDQSLLAQRGKDMGISVETDVVKQLDQIRIGNKLGSLDELEKAVTSQGLNWEDFKNNIRNHILTQKVVSQEVGSHISIGESDALKYYDEHKAGFVRPEQVALREIIINTEGKKDAELPDLKKKAETALKRVKDGEDFDEGEQSFDKVKNEIMDRLYNEKLEPAAREYLKTLREQSYVVIKPGFAELAGGGNSEIQEVSATPEASKKKKAHKKYILFGKNTSA